MSNKQRLLEIESNLWDWQFNTNVIGSASWNAEHKVNPDLNAGPDKNRCPPLHARSLSLYLCPPSMLSFTHPLSSPSFSFWHFSLSPLPPSFFAAFLQLFSICRWRDIYIGTRGDCVTNTLGARSNLSGLVPPPPSCWTGCLHREESLFGDASTPADLIGHLEEQGWG